MKRVFLFLLVLIFVISGLSISTFAVCVHTWGATYSVASHPHAYYRQCTKCALVQYTGGYATKAHGSGAWGSGTCPSCGSHSFSGTSCTTNGTCACGATTPAYGHNFGSTLYNESSHPHANFYQCSRCGLKSYTGTNSTKVHGNGAYGSGTCATCGTHTFVGATCTTVGTCACGATGSTLSHSYGSTTNCDAAHPHQNYQTCSACGFVNYTGTYSTKNHGNGEYGSGTCPSCGTHSFTGSTCTIGGICACGQEGTPLGHAYSGNYYFTAHPHEYYTQCYRCSATALTGGCATRTHGDGTNGTCSSCGTHAFVGMGCTVDGICSCGATQSASGHDFGEINADVAHPHQNYQICETCGYKAYIPNSYTIKPHGDGSANATCLDCGYHSWGAATYSTEHPHAGSQTCGCGLTVLTGTYAPPAWDPILYNATHPHEGTQKCDVFYLCVYAQYVGDFEGQLPGCPQCSGLSLISFSEDSYSLIIPETGNTTLTISATGTDEFGNAIDPEDIVYSLETQYDGVTIDSSTGVVSVTSVAELGFVRIVASNQVVSGTVTLNMFSDTSTVINLPAIRNNTYQISFTATNVTSFSERMFTLTYDPDVLQPVDLCAYTFGSDTQVGVVAATNITIMSVSPGVIEFTYEKTIPNGIQWSGLLNVFKFKALKTQETIVYTD